MRTVSKADEQWHFGIDRGELEPFWDTHGLKLIDCRMHRRGKSPTLPRRMAG